MIRKTFKKRYHEFYKVKSIVVKIFAALGAFAGVLGIILGMASLIGGIKFILLYTSISLIGLAIGLCLIAVWFGLLLITINNNRVYIRNMFGLHTLPMKEISSLWHGALGHVRIGTSSFRSHGLWFIEYASDLTSKLDSLIGELEANGPTVNLSDETISLLGHSSEVKEKIALEARQKVYDDCLYSGTISTDRELQRIEEAKRRLESISPYEKSDELIKKYGEMIENYRPSKK